MRDICWIFGVYVVLICLLKITLMHFTDSQRREENEYKRKLQELEMMQDDEF